jgi:hypothetical protein
VEVLLKAFLTWAQDTGAWLASRSGRCTPVRIKQKSIGKGKYSWVCLDSTLQVFTVLTNFSFIFVFENIFLSAKRAHW